MIKLVLLGSIQQVFNIIIATRLFKKSISLSRALYYILFGLLVGGVFSLCWFFSELNGFDQIIGAGILMCFCVIGILITLLTVIFMKKV